MAVNVGCEEKAQILQQWREIKDKHKCYDLDFVNELFEEYLRFITIKVASAGSGFDPIPSELVDSMWQAHILCTRLYTAFCSPLTKSKGLIHRNQSALTIPVSSQTGYRQSIVGCSVKILLRHILVAGITTLHATLLNLKRRSSVRLGLKAAKRCVYESDDIRVSC